MHFIVGELILYAINPTLLNAQTADVNSVNEQFSADAFSLVFSMNVPNLP
jgi:hypothetical protein